ncbi:hypothetical protein ACH5RR_024109 [Cinchona calisaya]|uniref:Uncharacterized protein n=1 Tax=Cinchona calisaya TaxID=153742 RepID=A0ABD2ZFN3_9GENT
MKNHYSILGWLTKLLVSVIFVSFITCMIYYQKLPYPIAIYIQAPFQIHDLAKSSLPSSLEIQFYASPNKSNISAVVIRDSEIPKQTQLNHIVFGIAASSHLWNHRKDYVKSWWRPREMRGFVWLDKIASTNSSTSDDDHFLPTLKLSSDTSKFKYKNKEGDRSALRLTRIVSETLRLGLEDVRWIVMGDDDTFFVADNLVRVLSKYDHNQFYYIGSNSESHFQNIRFSYNMAYGGGGFAISYPLAKALEKIQDKCIERYPELYGLDDRIQACLAELGLPLTKEVGFHQFDLYGNVFGILAAHPIAPLVSLHHLDVILPIFPNGNQVQALQRLNMPMKLDSAALMQQSICYDKARNWTISVSWGYAVQIIRGYIAPREMELPARSFVNWYKTADESAFAFNTRSLNKNSCQRPAVYTLSTAEYNNVTNQTISHYAHYKNPGHKCEWKIADPSLIRKVEVYKKPNPFLWDKSPRRNCCRVLPSEKKDTMVVDVGECREGEIIEMYSAS